MAVKILAAFKRPAIFSAAMLCFLVIVNRAAPADTMNQAQPVSKRSNSNTFIVAQNESETATNDKGAPSSESTESESKTDEKKKATGVEKKTLKDFRPTEKIEAEQAVDFPYDI